ncbi:hypothetical protein SDC9_91714 [bioreactor metagenome]|uniref:Uncharacterized protein n=1 Tax=bioreactor metagenome TaxID=1076179 RepID=A0A644ZVL5_9ZZZZ
MQPLGLHIEEGCGVEPNAGFPPDPIGQAVFVFRLDSGQPVQHARVLPEALQPLQGLWPQKVVLPPGQLPHQSVQPGVYLGEPAAVVDAVGHVFKLPGGALGCVLKDLAAQNVGVEGGHTVDGEAGAHAEVCHTHLPVPQYGQLPHPVHIPVKIVLQPGLPALGDFLQKLPDAGQEGLEEFLWPALQRLGQHGVVGVGHGVLDDVPRLLPTQALLVQQQAHKLRDHQSGVGVVDLNDVQLMEVAQGAVFGPVCPGDGLDCGRNKEILLLEAQRLALVVVVGGVEHLGDDLGHGLLLHRLEVLPAGVEAHVGGHGALGIPQAQEVCVGGGAAGDRHVPGHGQHGCISLMADFVAAVLPIAGDRAAEAHLLGLVPPGDQPGFPQLQPVIRQLGLLAVHDFLLEDAQLVADGIACRRNFQGGHGVQIAGGQPSEAAVAQARVRLGLK